MVYQTKNPAFLSFQLDGNLNVLDFLTFQFFLSLVYQGDDPDQHKGP